MNTSALFSRLRHQHLDTVMANMRDVVAADSPKGSSLLQMCDYHLQTGGKRLRAMLPLMVAESLGQDPERITMFSAACEMLHNATLVHDDLQDGDTVRRDQTTVWKQYGTAQAINLGDAMFYYAVLLVQRLELPAEKREAAARRLLVETLRVIDGQEQEFELQGLANPTIQDYRRMVEGKTSGLFALPMAGAAELCGAAPEIVEGLTEAARHLGVLFQIQDDLLDLYANKGRGEVGADIKEGKLSVLAVHGLAHASTADKAVLKRILEKPREDTSNQDVRLALEILEHTGSRQHAVDELSRRREWARSVPALANEPKLVALIDGLAQLFLEPIQPLLDAWSCEQAQEDQAFCEQILPAVSRTFALSIGALPAGLKEAVRTAYLLCRIVDTVEDDALIGFDAQSALFDAFDACLSVDTENVDAFEQLSAAFEESTDARLCRNAGRVFRAFRALEPAQREGIRPHVLEMSLGMREYAGRVKDGGALRLADMADLERYCYFVAGTVGNLLTELFELAVPSLDAAICAALRSHAVSFGLGLQMVNIVKDVAEDLERDVCFLPKSTVAAHGLRFDQLLDPEHRPAALNALHEVCARAFEHLEHAQSYTRLWPADAAYDVRLFCAVPLALALATLRDTEVSEDTLRAGKVVKVSHETVGRILTNAAKAVRSDEGLAELFAAERVQRAVA